MGRYIPRKVLDCVWGGIYRWLVKIKGALLISAYGMLFRISPTKLVRYLMTEDGNGRTETNSKVL